MWSIPSDNPEGKAFIGVIIFFLFIAILACGIRVYSRRLNRNALDASDCMCFLALVRCSKPISMLKALLTVEILDIFLTAIIWGGKTIATSPSCVVIDCV